MLKFCDFPQHLYALLGNHLTQDEQRRKLELVVDTARKVWGEPEAFSRMGKPDKGA